MLDFRDKLALDPETVAALEGPPHSTADPPDIELRECAILNVAAANMINQLSWPPRYPSPPPKTSSPPLKQPHAHLLTSALKLPLKVSINAVGWINQRN